MDPTMLALTVWGVPVITGIVWAVRQEGRINQHTTLFEQKDKQLDERHEELLRRLERIERKLDSNGRQQNRGEVPH